MSTNYDIFAIKHNDLLPVKGSFLISEPFLQDIYFQRAVVLMVEHTENGSMGIVLNKKTELIVNDFFPDLKDFPPIPIYLGGPVSSNKLFFIHSLGDLLIPGAVKVKNDIYFDGEFEALRHYILKGNPVEGKIKFFLGYSGWTEDQLQKEIKEDSWIVSHFSCGNLMNADGEGYWKSSLGVFGNRYKAWINFPKDPDLN